MAMMIIRRRKKSDREVTERALETLFVPLMGILNVYDIGLSFHHRQRGARITSKSHKLITLALGFFS
jgi:hypothetical protein